MREEVSFGTLPALESPGTTLSEHTKTRKQVVICPEGTTVIKLEGAVNAFERLFLSDDPRVLRSICSTRRGAQILVANRDIQAWVVNKEEYTRRMIG